MICKKKKRARFKSLHMIQSFPNLKGNLLTFYNLTETFLTVNLFVFAKLQSPIVEFKVKPNV